MTCKLNPEERGRCNSENAGQGSFHGGWHQCHVPWQKGAHVFKTDWREERMRSGLTGKRCTCALD